MNLSRGAREDDPAIEPPHAEVIDDEDMRAEEPAASEVPSPCIHDCRLDEARTYCQGCLRTLDEVVAWRTMDDAQRLRVLRRLAEAAPGDQRGGAA